MGQLTQVLRLDLISRRNRPTFLYSSNDMVITAMFDSGANIPVWCSGEKILLSAYPDAIKLREDCQISGFGQKNDVASIYKIPEFILESEGVQYKLKNLHIAVCEKPQIGCSLILSDTMFSKTDTFIKRRKEKILELYFDKLEYICTPIFEPDFKISVWAN